MPPRATHLALALHHRGPPDLMVWVWPGHPDYSEAPRVTFSAAKAETTVPPALITWLTRPVLLGVRGG